MSCFFPATQPQRGCGRGRSWPCPEGRSGMAPRCSAGVGRMNSDEMRQGRCDLSDQVRCFPFFPIQFYTLVTCLVLRTTVTFVPDDTSGGRWHHQGRTKNRSHNVSFLTQGYPKHSDVISGNWCSMAAAATVIGHRIL